MSKIVYKGNEVGGTIGSGLPVGTIIPYATGAELPNGFLKCEGQALSRALYPALFDTIGINYGAGDGSSTFNIPDLTHAALLNGTYEKTAYDTAGTYTFTAAKTGYYKITIKGAGGGGAAGNQANGDRNSGAGGGEGGTTFAYERMDAGDTAAIIVGAGGSGGNSSRNYGSNGDDTSITINLTTYTAGGGKGAGIGSDVGPTIPGAGGSGTIPGCSGVNGRNDTATNQFGGSGGGAGGGTYEVPSTGKGISGVKGGGGAGSAGVTAAVYQAGNGGDGYCWIEYIGVAQTYLIKTFDAQGEDSALIDITQYAAALADKANKADGVPLGTILPFTSNGNIPSGYLLCDGSAVGRSVYPDLFALIGTTYGEGNGIDTFNLPDLTDKFIEGSITAGDELEAGLPNITGWTSVTAGSMGGYRNSSGAFTLGYKSSKAAAIGDPTDNAYSTAYFHASDSSSVYKDDCTTVQPPALTMRYIIKAFNGILSGREMIDITQLANEVNQKFGDHELYEENFTIIYPNGGTAESPANITTNSRYVEANPFPGYCVSCDIEVYYNNQWGSTGWHTYYTSGDSHTGLGSQVHQLNDDKIVIRTGKSQHLLYAPQSQGNPFETISSTISSAPCRVKVWKIGKINS